MILWLDALDGGSGWMLWLDALGWHTDWTDDTDLRGFFRESLGGILWGLGMKKGRQCQTHHSPFNLLL